MPSLTYLPTSSLASTLDLTPTSLLTSSDVSKPCDLKVIANEKRDRENLLDDLLDQQ